MVLNLCWCWIDVEWIVEIEEVNVFMNGDGLLCVMVLFDLWFVVGEWELCDWLCEKIYESVGGNLLF